MHTRWGLWLAGALGLCLALACSSGSSGGGGGGGNHDCGQVCQHVVSLCPSEFSTQADVDECLKACNAASSSEVTCVANAPSCAVAEDCIQGGGGGSGGGGSGGGGATGGGGGSSGDCPQGTCVNLSDGAKACLVNGDLPPGAEYCSYSNKCPSGKYCIFNSTDSGCVFPCGGYKPPADCPSQCIPYGSSVCCGGAFCSGDCIGNPCC